MKNKPTAKPMVRTPRSATRENTVTLAQAKEWVDQFTKARDWWQFHTLKDDALDVVVEGGELAQLLRYKTEAQTRAELKADGAQAKRIRDETADVLWALMLFAKNADIDLAQALEEKLKDTALKYPVAKHKGRHEKYDQI